MLKCDYKDDKNYLLTRSPIEDIVVLVFFMFEELVKKFSKVIVIWSLEEIQSSDVSQVSSEFLRIAFTKNFYWSRFLRVADFLITLHSKLCQNQDLFPTELYNKPL